MMSSPFSTNPHSFYSNKKSMDLSATIVLASTTSIIFAALASFSCIVLRHGRCIVGAEDPELGAAAAGIIDVSVDALQSLQSKKDGATGRPSDRRFTWEEVELATSNFTSTVIGKGGFSTVFVARLHDSTTAAVKLHHCSKRLHRAFCMELDILRRLQHPNIVRLVGYCDEQDGQGALLFEYISNGSLHQKLHGQEPAGLTTVLPWTSRTSIACRIAQALDYLHDGCELQIVHGDIKAANILLDSQLNPKLCDFGCALMGFSAAVRPSAVMTGSPGYIDPHYIRTGMVSKKSDIYSFGVLLLELMTGAEAFDSDSERPLTAKMEKVLVEKAGEEVAEIVDRRLAGEFCVEEASAMASLAALCLGENPSLRPSMADVVRILVEKVPSSISTVGSDT